jgi:GAF domain-containing protein
LFRKLNEVSALLIRTPGEPGDLNSVLSHIAERAQDAFAADACVILAFNPITGRFIGTQAVGNLQVKNEVLHDRPRSEGVTQHVLREGLLTIDDLEAKPQYHNRFTGKEGFRAFAGLALRTRHRQKPLGVLYLDYRHSREFSSVDRESFRIFAFQAAFLLQETWLAHHYKEVARIGQQVNQSLATVEDLFQVLQTYVDSVLDESHTLMLAVYSLQTITFDIYLSKNQHAIHVNRPLGVESACKYIIETQETVVISQLSKEKGRLPFKIINITNTEEEESFIFVPLVLREVPLGVLSIQHSQPDIYGREDLFVLQLLGSYISLALHNMRLYDSLNQLNETGQLLTQQLEAEQTLQATVDKIREATLADVVILYPYEVDRQRFVLPPRVAGTLNSSFHQGMGPRQPNDIAEVALRLMEPIFAKESAAIYNSMHHDVRLREENFQQREKIRSTAVMPLRAGDDSVGVLFINFRQPQRFDATQKKLIDGLAHYAAIAIKNAQEYGSLIQRRVRELEILQNIDRELNQTLDLEEVLYTLLRLAHEHVPTEEASILLHNTKTHTLETAAAIGRHAEASREQNIFLWETKGITRWVVEHKKPVRIENLRRDLPWREMHLPVAEDIISELDVPLLDGEDVIGILNFESTREAALSQADQDFLVTLAGQAVLAIKNAQTYEREKRLAAESRVLNEISKEITSQLDLVHIFDLILDKALELTHAAVGNLMIYDPERNDLWMAAEQGVAKEKKGQRQKLDQGVVGYVARTKQLLNIDLSQQPWVSVNLDLIPGTCFELAVPMLAGVDLIGVLNVESRSSDSFTESDERLLLALAGLAVVALQNAQTYEREKRLAEESQVLNQISKEITSQLDLAHVFDLILEEALELTRCTLGSLHLYDPDRNDLAMAAERGVDEKKKGLRRSLNQGIVGYVARNQELLNVKDVTEPPWNEIYEEFIAITRSELSVPMLAGDELRGVLNVESAMPGHFNESDQRLLQGLADLAVIALQNAERYTKAERDTQRFELLYHAGQELSKITDLAQIDQAYEVIVQIAAAQSRSQSMIYHYDEANAELVLVCSSPHRQTRINEKIAFGEGLNGHVARERKTLVIDDKDHLPPGVAAVKQSDPSMHSFLVIPIMFKDQYYGNFDLRQEEVGHFRGTDILFFEGLAQQLASTIYRLETAKSHQESEQRARAAEEMSSIGQSAYEVTHRLGNDLGLVESYVEDIQTEMENLVVSSPLIDRKLDSILQSVQTVLSFSRDLKQELAKLGAYDEAVFEPKIVSPREILNNAARIAVSSHNIEVFLDIDEDVATVSVFPDLVADILHNLVTNAIQAMPQGGKLILRAQNAGRSVALQVTDTGVGIPQSMLANIFDLFFSTKGSSGFGLWSARRNALRNHGDLEVESQSGQGTTFTLLLPKANGDIL